MVHENVGEQAEAVITRSSCLSIKSSATTGCADGLKHPSTLLNGQTEYLKRVRQYYDTTTGLYLRYLGTTFQAGMLRDSSDPVDTLDYLASQAGIRPGQRLLDAGCGVCGPALHISKTFGPARIDAVTLSPVQAAHARNLVFANGESAKIRVFVGDFHVLPFPSESYDLVYFFESAGCSLLPRLLFQEMFRLLKPGGSVYVKEVCKRPPPLSTQASEELLMFEKRYVYRAYEANYLTEVFRDSGFDTIRSTVLDPSISVEQFKKAMFKPGSFGDLGGLNRFGQLHFDTYTDLPIQFMEFRALKPKTHR